MITGCFGLPGSGKSTFLAYIVKRALADKPLRIGRTSLQHNRHYDKIFTNYPYDGCYRLDVSLLGKVDFSNCLILIDEISSIWDSRRWKDFPEELVYFFSHHRKYNVDIIYCSQSYSDCDLRIRDKCENVLHITSSFHNFCRVTPLSHFMDVVDFKIVEGFSPASLFGSKFLYLPRYYSFFDTMSRRKLPNPKPTNIYKWGTDDSNIIDSSKNCTHKLKLHT